MVCGQKVTSLIAAQIDETLTMFAFGATEVDLRADLKVNTESVFPRERG